LGVGEFSEDFRIEGLQIYVPLNTPTTYEVTKPFAHAAGAVARA